MKLVSLALVGLMVIIALSLLSAIFTQWGWNGSIAEIFKVPEITFWQAFFLNMLGGMVCKGSSSSSSS